MRPGPFSTWFSTSRHCPDLESHTEPLKLTRRKVPEEVQAKLHEKNARRHYGGSTRCSVLVVEEACPTQSPDPPGSRFWPSTSPGSPQRLKKGLPVTRSHGGAGRGGEVQHTDSIHRSRLLPLGGERRGKDAQNQRTDERPSVDHRMISSARTMSDCGIVSPRAFAVFRLMTSSNFVDHLEEGAVGRSEEDPDSIDTRRLPRRRGERRRERSQSQSAEERAPIHYSMS